MFSCVCVWFVFVLCTLTKFYSICAYFLPLFSQFRHTHIHTHPLSFIVCVCVCSLEISTQKMIKIFGFVFLFLSQVLLFSAVYLIVYQISDMEWAVLHSLSRCLQHRIFSINFNTTSAMARRSIG